MHQGASLKSDDEVSDSTNGRHAYYPSIEYTRSMENQSFRQPEHIPEIPRPHYRPPYNPYMPPPPSNSTNTMGILGFIFSLLSLFIGFIPIFGWIIWVLGLIFSCIGLGRRPRARGRTDYIRRSGGHARCFRSHLWRSFQRGHGCIQYLGLRLRLTANRVATIAILANTATLATSAKKQYNNS